MEIVDIDYRRESGGTILRLFLGGADDRPVNLDDLSRVSRQLGDLLDVHDVVPGKYTLEVSSPGINRRLRVPAHFQRYLGKTVRVRCQTPMEGRRALVGILEAVDEQGIRIRSTEDLFSIRFEEIAQANYEADV